MKLKQDAKNVILNIILKKNKEEDGKKRKETTMFLFEVLVQSIHSNTVQKVGIIKMLSHSVD